MPTVSMKQLVKKMGYKTILEPYESEIVEKKSKFIGCLISVTDEDEAKGIWQQTKKDHHQANHVCYAYRLSGQLVLERYSDDGEPQGTAGMPILEVLRGQELENVMVMVVRYFGGTKLGTGGLVRAYTAAAKESLAGAKIITMMRINPMNVVLSYHLSGKVQHFFLDEKIYIEETLYETEVTFKLLIESDRVLSLKKQLIEMTGNQCEIYTDDVVVGYKEGNQINRLGR